VTKLLSASGNLEKIGEGGYGIVYMAEQSKPIRRRFPYQLAA